MNYRKNIVVGIVSGAMFAAALPALAEDRPAGSSPQPQVQKIDLVRPVGWGAGPDNFIPAPDGGKYLQITEGPNNQWRYAWYGVKVPDGVRTLSFRVEVNAEKLTAGRFDVGFYEFGKDGKTVRFSPVQVKPGKEWQVCTGSVTLHPRTTRVKFYFLGRNMGKGDRVLVRSFELIIPGENKEEKRP